MGQFVVTAPATGAVEAVADRLLLYPNPTSEMVFFEVEKNTLQEAACQVTDALGRVVLEQELTLSNGRGSIQTEGLAAGAYAARLLSGGKAYTGFFVKQ